MSNKPFVACDLCGNANADTIVGGVVKYVPSQSKVMQICSDCLSHTVVWDVQDFQNSNGDVIC